MNFRSVIPRQPEKRSSREIFSSFCAAAALLLLFAVLIWLSFAAMTETVDMNMNNSMLENVETHSDSIPRNLLLLAVFLAGALIWTVLTDRIPADAVIAVCVLSAAAGGILFVLSSQSAPTHDSLIVSRAAYQASLGDAAGLSTDYFRCFPFQLGYVLYSEGLIRLFGTGDNYLSIELCNVLCLAVSDLAILLSVRRLYGTGRTLKLCALLILICLPPILFCSFTYGNIPGLMFSALAVWQLLSVSPAHRGQNWLHAVLAALFIGLGIALKKNSMIILAAMLIVLVIRLIRKPMLCQAVCILLCAVSAWGFAAGAQAHYEKRFGLDFGKGIPMSSWAAMGLSDSYIAPGWYNAKYTVVNFRNCGMNPEKANEQSVQVIRERLSEMKQNPKAAAAFFSEKLRSEWNEPSYQSIWTNQVRGRYGEMGRLANWICGKGEYAVKGWMNAVQQLIFVSAALGCLFLLKKRRIEDALLPACILGGFLYHAVFEAKSQYLITYLVLLLPLAACGLAGLFGKIPVLFRKRTGQSPAVWCVSGNRIGFRAPDRSTGGERFIGVLKLKRQKSSGIRSPQNGTGKAPPKC